MAFRGYSNTLGRNSPGLPLDVDCCRKFLGRVGGTAAPVTTQRARRITHFIESLTSGGAERQMCNMAVAQKRAGFDVRVLLIVSPAGTHGHYLPLLQEAG